MKTIYVARSDRMVPNAFPGTYTDLWWANQSRLRGGTAGLDVNFLDICELARSARDGNPSYPIWGGTESVRAGTPVCLDMDWYVEQGWKSREIAAAYRSFKVESPHIPLTGYYTPAWPISEKITSPYITLEDYRSARAARQLELINKHLDFVCIRCTTVDRPWPYGGGYSTWLEVWEDFMPQAVKTVREFDPTKQVFIWTFDDSAGSLDYGRFAKAIDDSGADGVVLWGDDGNIPRLLAACQKHLPTTVRPPVRNPVRPPTGPLPNP